MRHFLLVSSLVLAAAAASADSWIPCPSDASSICFGGRYVGIGALFPGEKLHVGDGNILVEGGGETALKFKLDQTIVSRDSPV